jgi:hypothetical protein
VSRAWWHEVNLADAFAEGIERSQEEAARAAAEALVREAQAARPDEGDEAQA